MSDIVSDVLILLDTPKVIFSLTVVCIIIFCQSLLVIMNKKSDTIWILRWADDICYVNRQWLFSLFVILIWVPIVYWGDFLKMRWISIDSIFSIVCPILFVIVTSVFFIDFLRRNVKKRYLVDCETERIYKKKCNLFDCFCCIVFVSGNILVCLSYFISFDRHDAAFALYLFWQFYFIFGGVGILVPRAGRFILKFGFDGFHRSKKRNIK